MVFRPLAKQRTVDGVVGVGVDGGQESVHVLLTDRGGHLGMVAEHLG
jgi:hypothetical protein